MIEGVTEVRIGAAAVINTGSRVEKPSMRIIPADQLSAKSAGPWASSERLRTPARTAGADPGVLADRRAPACRERPSQVCSYVTTRMCNFDILMWPG